MDIINEILIRSGYWTFSHINSIALALVATLLVIYGDNLNRLVKKQLRPYPKLVRILGFVLMCAFGYGALTVLFTPVLANWLALVPVKWVGPLVVALFFLVGWLAENKRQV
ncbi:Protein of unknown function [Marinospirillum celere]|uniref:DUF3392 domain-containing protein n=1 Tax=Marinospirillum celere TaxID=1122252 RepID=A0A1I1FH40_9GAMM|nr:DUF3392 domain-containing protein [Marinospirillum celere]SFB98624.1 Protein of unknown function [Marinospirillum celere]